MLSKRLEAVAARVPEGARVADIGCDHAYLPIALLERGQVPHAIGCDINKGPLEAARINAARAGLDEERLELRLGNGLSPLVPGEVNVVTLAGMGAGLMVEILSAEPDVVASLSRIVVSPNVAPWLLRRWGMENGFAVKEETVVLDGGHFYEVFVLEPEKEPVSYSETALYFGVHLDACDKTVAEAYFSERWQKDAELLKTWTALADTHPEIAEKASRLQALWDEWRKRPCK